jgi:hypothetical protein
MTARRGWWLGAAATIVCSLVATLLTGSSSSSISTRPLTVIVATADALLVYAFAAAQFQRPDVGWAAAVLLLFTPAHVYFVRTASPRILWPVPLLLGWALLLTAHHRQRPWAATWALPASIALLAVAAVIQPSSALLIAAFGTLTLLTVRRADAEPFAATAIVGGTIGACVASLTLLIGPIGPFRAVAWQRAATVADWFWTFLLPSNLFVKADPLPSCGLFLFVAAVPMAVGVYTLVRTTLQDPRAARVESLILLVGSVAAPFGAAATGTPPIIARALIVVPLGVLVSVSGSLVMWNQWGLAGRIALVTLCAGGAVQAFICLTSCV